MPTVYDLETIAYLLYDEPVKVSGWTEYLTYNGKASEFGLPEPGFNIWSGEEYQYNTNGYNAYGRNFGSDSTGGEPYDRIYSGNLGLCLDE